MEQIDQKGQKAVPVYLPFKSFQSAVQSLRTHGLPRALDRTAFGSRSGADQIQILSAFKFLGLIDDANTTQPILRNLVSVAEGTPDEKAILASLLRERYANIIELNLEAATPAQVNKAIADYGAGGSTTGRSVRFFLKAAEYCGIKLSARLTARKPRSASSYGEDGETRRKKVAASTEPRSLLGPSGSFKTVELPNVGGQLTVSGTFNFFDLSGNERELVFGIIDSMKAFEKGEERK
jgi:hypothetical protein